jgi:ABC-type multidrug transport system ATPase subunit
LSLEVFEGDVYGFLGPNGAGKSTTIRMLLSLIFPTSGEIQLFGKNIPEHRNEVMQHVGAIVEKPDFYGYLSAYKNLEIFGTMQGADISKGNIMKILEWVGLAERAKSKVKTFSQGMKQRLGIAQALLHNPKLIILDEPTNGLDPQGMYEIREMIQRLNKDEKKTIIISSHILSEVELIANRMVIINRGKAIVEGNVNDLLNAGNMQVTFEFDDVEHAMKIIQQSELSKKLTSQQQHLFVFDMHKNDVVLANKFFVENNIGVISISPMRSLEQYFLSLT